MEFFAVAWFPLCTALILGGSLFVFRQMGPACRLTLFGGFAYFLFRIYWEARIMAEIPLANVPIRLDLIVLRPLDVFCLGICAACILLGNCRRPAI